MKSFAGTILSFEWTTAHEGSMHAYSQFLIGLACSQGALLIPILRSLVRTLAVPSVNANDESVAEFVCGEDDHMKAVHNRVHEILATVLRLVPLAHSRIEQPLSTAFPPRHVHSSFHQMYVKNLLRISEYAPTLSDRILGLVAERLILQDMEVPSSVCDDGQASLVAVEGLDAVMEILFQYLTLVRQADVSLRDQVFGSLLRVFDSYIFTAHKTRYVQFLVYFVCSFDLRYAEAFLRHVLLKMFDHGSGVRSRMVAASYVADYVARAGFLVYASANFAFQMCMKWSTQYVEQQHQQYQQQSSPPQMHSVKSHVVYFSVVQAMLHMIVHCPALLTNSEDDVGARVELLSGILSNFMHPIRHVDAALVRRFVAMVEDHALLKELANVVVDDDSSDDSDDEGSDNDSDEDTDVDDNGGRNESWVDNDDEIRDEIGMDGIDDGLLSPYVSSSSPPTTTTTTAGQTPALKLTLSPTTSPLKSGGSHKMIPPPMSALSLTPSAHSLNTPNSTRIHDASFARALQSSDTDQKARAHMSYHQPFQTYSLPRSRQYLEEPHLFRTPLE